MRSQRGTCALIFIAVLTFFLKSCAIYILGEKRFHIVTEKLQLSMTT
jgi:hypothetical protein